MWNQLGTRAVLKAKKIARGLNSVERTFQQIWPLIDPIEGWLLEGQEKWLYKQALSLPNGSNLVEIGSYKGRSTCCLAFGCRGSQKRVYAIDTFTGGPDLPEQDSFQAFMGNLERCGLTQYVEPKVGLSTEIAKGWDKPIDFLFVDGSHRYEDVFADFSAFFPHVAPGGIVAFHDVIDSWPGVLRVWNENASRALVNLGRCSSIAYGLKPQTKT